MLHRNQAANIQLVRHTNIFYNTLHVYTKQRTCKTKRETRNERNNKYFIAICEKVNLLSVIAYRKRKRLVRNRFRFQPKQPLPTASASKALIESHTSQLFFTDIRNV